MNASNLMAVSPADGISAGAGASKGRAASVGNRAQVTSGKNSFSDTFGALQKGMTAGAAKTETRETPTAAAQTKVPQAGSTATSQNTQDVTAETPKTADETQAAKGTENVSADDAAAVVAALAALVNADAAIVDTNVNEGLDAALTEILERYDLTADALGDTKLQNAVQNLLQQMPEETAKSRNFLLALEGQPLAQETADPAAQGGSEGAVLRMTALDSVLPMQLRATLNTASLPTEAQVPVVDISEFSTANAAQRSNVAAALNPEAQTALLGAQREGTQNVGRSAAELIGENLTTEDSAANPLTVLAQRTMRHDASQGDAAGQEAQQEQLPGESQQPVRTTTTAPLELPTRAAEPSMQGTPQPIAAQTGTTPPAQEVSIPASTQETQRPQPDYEIPRQIVEQARLLRSLNDTQMVIRLRPEHLGELTLRVSVGSNGAVQASFHSDNAQVRNVIENSLVQLRQELNNQGLKVDRVGVYAGLTDGQMPQGQGQEAWQQSSSRQSGTQQVYARGDADDYLDEIDGLAPLAAEETGGSVGSDGVDYRV
ncbi:flagellar hook-length control protein [Selenomonas sp. oral taxon 920]|uniref:flagellar hook-length control protein FliK n=1 Tax=Selenomonas sp. oral taxon 920 TaxID=1884263 RepID=UPI000840B7F8|nr:flagellar hook-length control protein FliK [Selenomonas sp. oral taxon 920]AOH47739.1 flagellar hook-length control protein [Selenomonas sp. oral taxon 920]